MATLDETTMDRHIRDLADSEVSFYREHGWVTVRELVTSELAGELLRRAQALMGMGVEHVKTYAQGIHQRGSAYAAMWRNYEDPSVEDGFFRRFGTSPQIGRVASRLLRDRPVRFLRDEILVKMPTDGGGIATGWHQDFPFASRDRSAQITIWIALVDLPAERGTLSFLSGSHTWGVLGRTLDDPDDDLVRQYPELPEECPLSPPIHLAPGDATMHGGLTAHRAEANATHQPRWAYTVRIFQADAYYTGAPQRFTDQLEGLKVNYPFDHPRTPQIWPVDG
ncbi:MAG: phytanoyl-CoA dioxygenase family protein [Solirubrobacteraceae bacterium]